MARESVSAGRIVAELGHLDSVKSARQVNDDMIAVYLSGSLHANDIGPIRREFGWTINGVTPNLDKVFLSGR